jgi:hypothetical protein
VLLAGELTDRVGKCEVESLTFVIELLQDECPLLGIAGFKWKSRRLEVNPAIPYR